MSTNEIMIAVSPLENLSEDQTDHLFCQAFSMDLVTELSRFRQFQIIAGDPLMGGQMHAEQVQSQHPGLDYLIRGSFRSLHESVRINAQLINAKTNALVWAERFDGDKTSILTMQEDLLREIVSSLQQQLDYDLLSQLRKKPAIDLRAYEYWLRGMTELKKGTIENDIQAREYFQQAIEINPNYSLAYSGMSLSYFNEWSCQLWERWEVSRSGAYEWAKKAIELDDQNYVAAVVLGRTLMFTGAYEQGEHYLRKALKLNPNDTENLLQITICFLYLGYPEEAEALYNKALQLDPLNETGYHQIGAVVFLELGDFQKAIELGVKLHNASWVDFPGFLAAAYYHAGDLTNMQIAWQKFLTAFEKKIVGTVENLEEKAVKWMKEINPYRGKTQMNAFWEYILQSDPNQHPISSSLAAHAVEEVCVFQNEADLWLLVYEGQSVRMSGSKGFHDLTKLVSQPGRAIHCLELMGSPVVLEGKTLLFDEKAKKQYQHKILELQAELSEAEASNDLERAVVVQKQYDDLLGHLSKGLGLQGKIRQTNNGVEKARLAVTWRIRKAIQTIEKAHPALGRHLKVSVKTGTFCTYNPEKILHWQA